MARKLVLKKETVANLEKQEAGQIVGGGFTDSCWTSGCTSGCTGSCLCTFTCPTDTCPCGGMGDTTTVYMTNGC